MNSPIAYCFKICHKIGFYLLKLYGQELIRMKCEFYQDENGRIWLFNVSDIWIRIKEGVKKSLFDQLKSPAKKVSSPKVEQSPD